MSENNEEQLTDESTTHAAPLEVGRRLREAREAKGLSIESVARELRLNEKLINALEAGRSDELPPATFVSGYLRGYGRLLGLDGDALVRDYHGDEQSAAPLAPKAGAAEVRSSDAPVKAITYLIVIALVVLLVLWWFSRQPGDTAPAAEPQVESLAAGESMDLSLPPAPPEVEIEPEAEPEELEAEPQAQPEPEPEPEVVAEPELKGAELELSVIEDSWMEVYDSDGARLAYGLYKGGREVKVQGQAPFKLFFGYAPGIGLKLNGASIDVMRHKRSGNDTARFQLGSAEDNDR